MRTIETKYHHQTNNFLSEDKPRNIDVAEREDGSIH